MLELLASGGIVNKGLNLFRLAEGNMNLRADPNKFYMIFTVISIIKSIGYGSILYYLPSLRLTRICMRSHT